MNPDTITLLLLCGVALALAIAWELLTTRGPRTPIPDVFKDAFPDGH